MKTNQDYFWMALTLAFWTALLVIWVLKRMKLRRARVWPTEVGRVDSSVLTLKETGEAQSAWFAIVKYSYTV